MRVSFITTLIACLVIISGCARGDYLEVRRHALIKTEPIVDAPTIREAIVGEFLPLRADQQTNGYYRV